MAKKKTDEPKPVFQTWHPGLMEADQKPQPLEAVELVGDGWTIRVRPTKDGHGLHVSCQGMVFGAGELIVIPKCSNEVHIHSDVARAATVCKEAQHLHDVEKENEAHRKKTGYGKSASQHHH